MGTRKQLGLNITVFCVLAACGGGGGDALVECGSLEDNPIGVVNGLVQKIQGISGNETVALVFPDRRCRATLTPDGRFFAPIFSGEEDLLLKIEVSERGTQTLQSFLGKVGLERLSSAPGDVDDPRLIIDPLSSALGFATTRSGLTSTILLPPPSDSKVLRQLEATGDSAKLLSFGTMLSLIDTGSLSLPPGIEDLEQLLASPPEYNELYVRTISNSSAVFDERQQALLRRNLNVPIFEKDGRLPPAELAIIFYDPRQFSFPTFTFSPDGTGTFTAFDSSDRLQTPEQMSWTIDANSDLVITPLGGGFVHTVLVEDSGDPVLTEKRITRIRIQPFAGDHRSGPARFEFDVEFRNQSEVRNFRINNFGHRFDLADEIQLPIADLIGRPLALEIRDDVAQQAGRRGLDYTFADQITLLEDGTVSSRYSRSFATWTETSTGRLSINYQDGVRVEQLVLAQVDSVGFSAISRYITPEGRQFDGAGFVTIIDESYRPAPDNITGVHHQYSVGSEGFAGEADEFRLRFFDDLRGTTEQVVDSSSGAQVFNANSQPSRRFHYRFANEREILVRHGLSDSGEPCSVFDQSMPCRTTDQRDIVGLNRTSNRVWWLENRQLEDGIVERSIRYYDVFPQDPLSLIGDSTVSSTVPSPTGGATTTPGPSTPPPPSNAPQPQPTSTPPPPSSAPQPQPTSTPPPPSSAPQPQPTSTPPPPS